jgi:hypothetical protein
MRFLPLLVVLAVAIVLLLPLLRRIRMPAWRTPRGLPDELVKDPVCQTYIVKSRAVRRMHGEQVRYFCSERCARLGAGG